MRRRIRPVAVIIAIALLFPVVSLAPGCGVDESTEIKEENYNPEVEDFMRSGGRRSEMLEEQAEEQSYQEQQGNE